MIFTAKNGDTIEIEQSSNGHPPGVPVSTPHTNGTTTWARVPGGEWRRVHCRSLHRAWTAATEGASAAAFFGEGENNG